MNHSVFFQKPAHSPDDTAYCTAVEMALVPLSAAHHAVMESWHEAQISANQSKSTNHFFEYLHTILAAPFAYTPAVLMAIIGFIYGLGIDCRFAIENMIENARSDHDDSVSPEENSNNFMPNSF